MTSRETTRIVAGQERQMTRDLRSYKMMLMMLMMSFISSQTGCHRLNFNVIAMS